MNDIPAKLPQKKPEDVLPSSDPGPMKAEPVRPAVFEFPDEVLTFGDKLTLFFHANGVPIVTGLLSLLGFKLNLSMFSPAQITHYQTEYDMKTALIGEHPVTSILGYIGGLLTLIATALDGQPITWKTVGLAIFFAVFGRSAADAAKVG